MKTYTGDMSDIENLLCNEAIEEICRGGCNDEAIKKWLNHYIYELGQLNICPLVCKKIVESYGFDRRVENKMQWMERALWLAAWNAFEIRQEMEQG